MSQVEDVVLECCETLQDLLFGKDGEELALLNLKVQPIHAYQEACKAVEAEEYVVFDLTPLVLDSSWAAGKLRAARTMKFWV